MRKIIYVGLVIIFGFILSTFAMVPAVPAQTSTSNSGTFVGEVASLAPGSLDPAVNFVPQGEGYIQLMYEGLFQYTNNSVTEILPDLAISYTVSTNGTIYTFKLRSGVTFSLQGSETTGQPFNAYVMQYSIDRAIIMNDFQGPIFILDNWIKGAQAVYSTFGNLNKTQAIAFLNLQSVKALNASTLQITLAKPYSGFIQTLLNPIAYAVSPKAIIDNKPTSYTTSSMVSLTSFFPGLSGTTILSDLGLPGTYNIGNSGVVPQATDSWLATHSAGTGPYTLVSFASGSTIDFAKNNNWWNKNNFQQYSVNSIKITQVSSAATRVSDLQQGIADTADIPVSLLTQFGVSSSHPSSTYTGVNSYVYNGLQNNVIGMNLGNALQSGLISENTATSNYNYGTKNVTKLLKYSWKNTTGNLQYAIPSNPFSALLFREAFAYVFPTQTYINQALGGFGIRMEGAIPLGILGHDNNLIANGNIPTYNTTKAKQLFNEVGWKGTITIDYITGNSQMANASALLQSSIQGLGVGITIKTAGISNYINEAYSSRLPLVLSGWPPDYAGAYDFAQAYYQEGVNLPTVLGYNNPYVNNSINQAVAALSQSAMVSNYTQMETNASGDYLYIYLNQEQNVLLVRSDIQGINTLQADSLNPITYSLEYQFLGKQNTVTVPTTPTTSPITNTTPTQKTSTPGFEAISILSIIVFAIIIDIKKKIK